MNKALLLLVYVMIAVSSAGEYTKTISIGGAFAVGETGWEPLNPGIAGSIDIHRPVYKDFALGGHFDYTWLSLKNIDDLPIFNVGYHLLDCALFPGYIIPIERNKHIILECGPAFHVHIYYETIGAAKSFDVSKGLGIFYGIGALLGPVSVMGKWKTVFTGIHSAHWITLVIGLPLAG